MFAIKFKKRPMLVFLFRKPNKSNILDFDSAEADVEIDVPQNSLSCLDGLPSPEQAIGRSCLNPKLFKVFRYSKEMEQTDLDWTRLSFGGIFATSTWERFERQANSDPDFMAGEDESIDQNAFEGLRG